MKAGIFYGAILILVILDSVCSLKKSRRKRQDDEEEAFECPYHDGLFADPVTCRRFYICSGNYPFRQNCPPSLFFDDVKKFCTRKGKDLVCGPAEGTTTVPPTPDPLAAPKCDPAACRLPECFCSSDGTRIPGELELHDTPQMVIMTFDGGVNGLTYDHYRKVLNQNSRKNPNGCPIKATFFVSHEYSSYFHVQKVYADGHEVAVHSISHRTPETYWTKASYENWTEEMVGMREVLHKFANISRDTLLGIRAPFLKPGGNVMMSMMYDYGFVYDSSIVAPISRVPVWPYTLDYKIPHFCVNGNCPGQSFPGIWEIPLNTMHTEDGTGGQCVLADQCVFPEDNSTVYDFLVENFDRHYLTNRAPFGLYFHVNWFNEKMKVKVLHKFIDNILGRYRDVWFVTMQQAIRWMRNPTVSANLNTFVPWECEKKTPACNLPTTCALPFTDNGPIRDIRYMQTCMPCPVKYPWVGNFEGAYRGQKIIDLSRQDDEEDELN